MGRSFFRFVTITFDRQTDDRKALQYRALHSMQSHSENRGYCFVV